MSLAGDFLAYMGGLTTGDSPRPAVKRWIHNTATMTCALQGTSQTFTFIEDSPGQWRCLSCGHVQPS